jgi:hypothetical protein
VKYKYYVFLFVPIVQCGLNSVLDFIFFDNNFDSVLINVTNICDVKVKQNPQKFVGN